MANKSILNLLVLFILITEGISDIIFNIENDCLDTLWLAASPSDGDLDPQNGPGTLEIFSMTDPWSGSIWVRTKCTTNATGYFSCETGDCGSGVPDCQGPPPTYPVTQLNFNINQGEVSYEVSLIHGHNLAVRIEPDGGSLVGGGSGPCPVVDCVGDIGSACPSPLVAKNKGGVYVGCYSACDAFKDPKFCQPNQYSTLFKNICNLAHTYSGDNSPPLYKCKDAKSYNITFCPV